MSKVYNHTFEPLRGVYPCAPFGSSSVWREKSLNMTDPLRCEQICCGIVKYELQQRCDTFPMLMVNPLWGTNLIFIFFFLFWREIQYIILLFQISIYILKRLGWMSRVLPCFPPWWHIYQHECAYCYASLSTTKALKYPWLSTSLCWAPPPSSSSPVLSSKTAPCWQRHTASKAVSCQTPEFVFNEVEHIHNFFQRLKYWDKETLGYELMCHGLSFQYFEYNKAFVENLSCECSR